MWLLTEYDAAARVPGAAHVEITHADDVLPSRLATTDLALGSVAAAAGAALRLSAARRGTPATATVDGRRVSASFRSDKYLALDGESRDGFAPLSRFWQTRDGWIRTHANYPHHRSRLLAALDLSDDTTPEQLAAAVSGRDALELEATLAAHDAIGVAVRTPEQWAAHPQAAAIAAVPIVAMTRLDDAPARPLADLTVDDSRPAAGVRVLDLTRVIAGPVASRTLALLGADVLRVDSAALPEIPWQHLDTGMGKRSTLLDLATESDQLETLLRDAHVVLVGYRPDALTRFGLSPAELATRHPGLVVATLDAWGGVGPWGRRRGFDSIVQAATGIAVIEGDEGEPGALPAQALDHATGYLLAAAVLDAVARQREEPGSVHVQAHLARTAASLLRHRDATPRRLPDVTHLLRERPTPDGRLRYAPPALQVAGAPDDWDTVGGRWGSDPPEWRPSGR